MAKRKARVSDETFDEFLAQQRILGACEQRAIQEITAEQLAEAVIVPRSPIHPGEHLAEELRELGFTAAELSRQINVPVNRITSIIHGQRGITADTALRLGHWFGTSAEFWMNLQQQYELRLAKKQVGMKVAALPRRATWPRSRKLGKTA